ncbi:hypothetical protein D3C81_2006100 [compost metagenome]
MDNEPNIFVIVSMFSLASIDFTPFVSVRSNAKPDISWPLTVITTLLLGENVVGELDELEPPLPELGEPAFELAPFRMTSRLYFLIVPS